MANEFRHASVGTELSQSEWEAVGTHIFNSQATGDILYASSATQLSRLAIGSTNQILTVTGGVPAWTATPTLTSATVTTATITTANITTGDVTTLTTSGATVSGLLATSRTLTSQTTENNSDTIALTTDSTYLTGTNMTYSGARGSAALKLTGTWTGATGGFSALYANVASSGAIGTDGNGVIATKCVVTNSAAVTDGEMYGGQFIAKHSHATNDMGKSASLVGLEGWSYDASTGTVGTMIGGNFGYHNECTTAQESGSVHRGVQIFCDDASGAANATESQALCLWNMAGTQHDAIRIVQSGSGFTNMLSFSAASAPVAANTHSIDGHALQHIITVKVGSDTGYIPVFDSVPS